MVFINLVLMQIREFVREPEVLFWALIFPIAIAGALGLAFQNDKEPVRVVALTGNVAMLPSLKQLADKQALQQGQDPTREPVFIFSPMSEAEAMRKLRRGEVLLIAQAKGNDSLVFQFDPKNTEARMAQLMLQNTLYGKEISQFKISERIISTQGSRYIDFLIPGLIAMGVMNSCMWGIGWHLIQMRIKKLLRRMIATPMNRSLFLSSVIFTRMLINIIEAAVLIVFSWLSFGVEIQGSVAAFFLLLLAGVWAFAGIAILVGSRATNTEVGNGLSNAVTLPMTLLSGIFFSYQGFPDWAISFIKLLPLTLLSDSLRAVCNEGAGLPEVWQAVLILLCIGTGFFAAGRQLFKWY